MINIAYPSIQSDLFNKPFVLPEVTSNTQVGNKRNIKGDAEIRRIKGFLRRIGIKIQHNGSRDLFDDYIDLQNILSKCQDRLERGKRTSLKNMLLAKLKASGVFNFRTYQNRMLDAVEIPEQSLLGKVFIKDDNGFEWSAEGINILQDELLCYSLRVLGLETSDDEEKMDVVLWMFDDSVHLFSFHNCCVTCGIANEDELIKGVLVFLPEQIKSKLRSAKLMV